MDNVNFDSITFAKEPDLVLSELRKEEGLYPYELPDGTKVWLVTRRADVEEVLLDKKVFQVTPALDSQSYHQNPFSEAIPTPNHLLATDGSSHQRLRLPLEHFFTKEKLDDYREAITAEVRSVLTKWKSGEIHDLSGELAYYVPVKVISAMLGIGWQEKFPDYGISLQLVKGNPQDHLKNVADFHQLIREAIANKKKQSGNDIISTLLESDLSEEEVLSMSLLIFMAGSGTTAGLISQGLYQIVTNKKLPGDNLVDEILYKTSPANSAFPRYSHADYELSGTSIKKGDILIALLTSANYDTNGKNDALQNYLSFSKGIHHCIGWYLAKMEAEIVFDNFHAFFPDSKMQSEEWFINITSRSILSLMVELG